jgi:hypothetical protein
MQHLGAVVRLQFIPPDHDSASFNMEGVIDLREIYSQLLRLRCEQRELARADVTIHIGKELREATGA